MIEPIVDDSVGDGNAPANSLEPAEPELESVENSTSVDAEPDVESFPQVDFIRVSAESE